jgi:hypothetical protein
MKFNIKRTFVSTVLGPVLVMVIAISGGLALPSFAADEMQSMKGAEHLMMLKQIKTRAQAEALKPGDQIAMACAKCKSVMVENVTTEKGHIKVMTVGEKHLCPGCNSTITVVGTGKQAKDVVKHVCQKCGEDSVYCCATKAGSGPTEGMEHK